MREGPRERILVWQLGKNSVIFGGLAMGPSRNGHSCGLTSGQKSPWKKGPSRNIGLGGGG